MLTFKYHDHDLLINIICYSLAASNLNCTRIFEQGTHSLKYYLWSTATTENQILAFAPATS